MTCKQGRNRGRSVKNYTYHFYELPLAKLFILFYKRSNRAESVRVEKVHHNLLSIREK